MLHFVTTSRSENGGGNDIFWSEIGSGFREPGGTPSRAGGSVWQAPKWACSYEDEKPTQVVSIYFNNPLVIRKANKRNTTFYCTNLDQLITKENIHKLRLSVTLIADFSWRSRCWIKCTLLFKVAMREKKMKNFFQQYLFLTLSPVWNGKYIVGCGRFLLTWHSTFLLVILLSCDLRCSCASLDSPLNKKFWNNILPLGLM